MEITSERMIPRCPWHGRVRAWEECEQIAIYGWMCDVLGGGRGWITSRVVVEVVWSIGGKEGAMCQRKEGALGGTLSMRHAK